jgi:hypothetical protein
MKKTLMMILVVLAAFSFGFYTSPQIKTTQPKTTAMKLGAFSVSLSVKDLSASKKFYENLGFAATGGDLKMNYLIMRNGNALIGLF